MSRKSKQVNQYTYFIFFTWLFLNGCEPNLEDNLLPLTQFRRSVLDQQVRMLSLRYDQDQWAAYSLNDPPRLVKVWRGGVTWNGVNYNSMKQIQPESYGEAYEEDWDLDWKGIDLSGQVVPLLMQYSSYLVEDGQITFSYHIDHPSFTNTVVREQPHFDYQEGGQLRLKRHFFVQGLETGLEVRVQGQPLSSMPTVVTYVLDSLPYTAYPTEEVVAKTSHYWLAKTGCNTCHTMDYQMVGPSYRAIAEAYQSDKETIAQLVTKIQKGGSGIWGDAVMIPHPQVAEEDIERMVIDILSLAPDDKPSKRKIKPPKSVEPVAQIPGFGSSLSGVHPAFALKTIRPNWFQPKVGSMDFGSDGELFVGTWDSVGAVYQMTGVETHDTNQIEIVQIASGLAEPLGMEVVGEDLFVMQKHELTQLVDHNGDDVIDEYISVCHGFEVSPDFHEFAYDIEFVDGYFYGTLGIAMRLMSTELQLHDRGTVFKTTPNGDFEILVDGLRQPNGIGVGIDGELFTTENQGRWVPACKLIHIRPGDFHGCVQRQGDRFAGREVTPPACWLPQDEIGNSPSEPLLMTEGPYAGQMIFGDVTHGGITRAFLEKIDGAYQGAIFRFCQGFEAGINRIVRGPDDGLYVGGVGMSGGWSHDGKSYGLQKLVYEGEVPFEMLAIRATPDGFSIEFTKPIDKGILLSALPLVLRQWHYTPTANYGGPKLDNQVVPISAIKYSDDGKSLHITTPQRKVGYVIHFAFDSSFTNVEGDSLWSGDAWYTLNAVPAVEEL